MSLPAQVHARIHEQLFALANRLEAYDGLTAELHDTRVVVTGAGGAHEVVTCAPRPSDGDRLWFWDSRREPVAEADRVIDAAVSTAARLR